MTTSELIAVICSVVIVLVAAYFFIYGYIYDRREIEEIEKFLEGIKKLKSWQETDQLFCQ